MPYEMLCSSVQGASHIKTGTPCEDYGLGEVKDGMYVFVTADGHGDSNCPRSRFGSEMICNVAARKLFDFGFMIRKSGWEPKMFPESNYESAQLSQLMHQLIVSIVAEWTEIINADLHQNPLTEDERAACPVYIEKYDRGERLEHIYGTTMIAGLCTGSYILLLQQGDGRCVVFDQSGMVSQPVPWDDRCFLNITTSMCDLDVVESIRYTVLDQRQEQVAAILACSDGIEDTFFGMDHMYVYLRSLLSYAGKHGIDDLHQHLEETLPEFSAKGSQDDCTITGIIDCRRVGSLEKAFERENSAVMIRSRIKALHEQIDREMPPKLDYLEKRAKIAEQKYKLLLVKEQDLEVVAEKSDYEEVIERSDPVPDAALKEEIKLSPGENEMLECRKIMREFEEYKERYDAMVQQLDELVRQLDDLDKCKSSAPIEADRNNGRRETISCNNKIHIE